MTERRRRAFDRFAEGASAFASRPVFFAGCVIIVLVWLPSLPLFGSVEKWQLPINTLTTIITFLMVALLENATRRFENAVNFKLNAIAAALADFMVDIEDPDALREHVRELREAVGLEEHVEA